MIQSTEGQNAFIRLRARSMRPRRATIGDVTEEPRMNEHSWCRESKLSRVHEPHVASLNALVEAWRQEGLDVPWVDPDRGGVKQ